MLGLTRNPGLDFGGCVAGAGMAIQTGSTARTDFQPSPLEPTWVLEGNPTARSLPLTSSADGNFSCGLWDCTAGKFNFTYFCDELIHILEGEVRIEGNGQEYVLRAGDVAFFPQGLTACWTVPNYVRKYCIFRSTRPSLLGRIRSKAGKVLRRLLRLGR